MKRNIYLSSTDLDQILPIIEMMLLKSKYKPKFEIINTVDSLNRITFEPIYAKVSSPFYTASAMDGVALKASLTYEATETNPVMILKEDYKIVNTGDVIPLEYDTVVMIEDVILNNDKSITIHKSAGPFQHIRPIGEDIVQGDMVLSKSSLIRPVDISALLSAGISQIKVLKKPIVSIIPTGDEIITDPKDLEPGKIIDSNSHYIKNELVLLGANPIIEKIQKDVLDTLEKQVLQSTKSSDLVIIGAGSSAGTKDFARSIIEKNGTLLVHGISIKPGKPTIIGMINNTPIIGIPGYPVSTFISFDNVVRPIINIFLNQQSKKKQFIEAKLTKKVYSSLKNLEFIRVKLGKIGNSFVATPLDRGAGVTMSLVKADGIMLVDKNSEGYEALSIVNVYLLKELDEIEKSLIVIGSHDIILDKIDNHMRTSNRHLSSSHVGSFGGIMAIKNKGCHVAPIHILNEDGLYNRFVINKYLDDSYTLVKGITRIQGLYVKKGNPKNIQSLSDLTRDDISYVNRQRGSGTRILLDYLLKKNEIDYNKIKGYDYELGTHMLVASSVKDERYDCGLGIFSVAKLANLDFIKIGEENYDFIVLKEIMNTMIFTEFISILKSKEFKRDIHELGGYKIENIGEVIK